MRTKRLVPVLGALALLIACAKPPVTLSPKGQTDFKKLQVVHQLDALRDAAIAANGTTPALLSTDTTRLIVKAHKAAILGLGASDWQHAVKAEIDALPSTLPAKEAKVIQPYVGVIDAILDEVFP